MKLFSAIIFGLSISVIASNIERRQLDIFKIFSKITNLIDPEVISKVPLLFQADEPKLLDKPRKFKHTTIPIIILNLNNSLISACLPEKVISDQCMCSSTYSNQVSIFNEEENVQTVVAINNKFKQIVVSYRPTLNILNAIDNLDHVAEPVDFAPKDVKVHRGFYRVYLATRKRTQREVIKILNNLRYREYPLHVTGYSLGAAVATMPAFDWSRILKNHHEDRKLEIFSYSSPRVGNDAFVERLHQLDIPVTRFTSSNDLVLHLPPRSFGFVHAGAELYAEPLSPDQPNANYQLRVCSQRWDEDPSCAWKNHRNLSFQTHLNPLGSRMQRPPFC